MGIIGTNYTEKAISAPENFVEGAKMRKKCCNQVGTLI